MNPSCWLLEGQIARLSLPCLTAVVNAAYPAGGLTSICIGGQAWQAVSLLGVSSEVLSQPNVSLADWHVRANELVAVYESGKPDDARVDVRWQFGLPGAGDPWLARVDLLVSIRTDRLDWRHDVFVAGLAAGAMASELHGCIHLRLPRGGSYVEMIHPADLRRRELPTDELSSARDNREVMHLRRQLFAPEMLEKGVILRARIRGLFFLADVETKHVASCYDEFIAADPPLE
jgi:hypothetical protein